MSWNQAADWVQAVGSLAAIIIAIWTVRQQANRERDNRVIDDAAFASYVNHFLTEEIERKVEEITEPENIFETGRSVAEISSTALSRYEGEVTNRVEKLADLPLTDWPDVQFANSFNNAYLRMKADLERLKANQKLAAGAADRARIERKREEQNRVRRLASEDEELVEQIDEIEGDVDDGRAVMLPPKGQRRRLFERDLWAQARDDEEFEPLDAIRAREAEEERSWGELWTKQEQSYALEALQESLFDKLRDISGHWREQDEELRQCIDRYIERAQRYRLPTTYEGRANRPKRLAPIFR